MKPKARKAQRFWESLSDDELLKLELLIDNPEKVDGLVKEVPEGGEETYVEFKYDLRNSGQEEEFTCVHGHHKHLAGFVMRKGDKRFMVGWICGKTIYGEDFDQYTSDFDTAVNRQQSLKRKAEIQNLTMPFMAWLEQVANEYDNPKKRRYEARLLEITCSRDKTWTSVKMPRHYEVPNREPLVKFKEAVQHI